MKLTMLGTGNALVTECYNTCFVLSDEYGHFLVDGGGGNTVLSQLKKAGIDLNRKVLADLAVNDAAAFAKLVEVAKNA